MSDEIMRLKSKYLQRVFGEMNILSKKSYVLLLGIIYLLAHGFLLVASGRWWDDWLFWNISKETLWNVASQTGRPSIYYLMGFVEAMPEPMYRILTFLMFWFCVLFYLNILKNWFDLDDYSCFWICTLYEIIPTDDTRIIHGAFPYTTGLFFFMAGMCYLSFLIRHDTFSLVQRLTSLLLFSFSFVLNSNLCFYVIALLMILMKKGIKSLFYYVDYIILPVLIFCIKTRFFPVWGYYENYNIVTMRKILGSIQYLPIADIHLLRDLISNLCQIDREKLIVVLMGALIIWFFISRYRKTDVCISLDNRDCDRIDGIAPREKDGPSRTHVGQIRLLVVGTIATSAAVFPYLVSRFSYEAHDIKTTYFHGRDGILTPFGISLVLYSLICVLLNSRIREFVLLMAIICGIIYFNTWYLSYQQNWYMQTAFRYQLMQHKELKYASNVLCLIDRRGKTEMREVHVLSANAEMVYGDASRVMAGDRVWIERLKDRELMDRETKNKEHHMYEHNNDYTKMDYVLTFSFDVDLLDVIKMKLYELMRSSRFDDWIRERSRMDVYMYGTKEYDGLLMGTD